MNSDIFQNRLKKLIGSDSVRSFAHRCGLSDSVLRKYLAGKSEPGMSALISMARAGKVTIQWLATGEGPMKAEEKEKGGGESEKRADFDLERLQLAIETIEEALQETGRAMKPNKKAEMVVATYEFFGDEEQEKAKAKVIRLLRTAI